MAQFKVKSTGAIRTVEDAKTLKRVRADPLAYEEVEPEKKVGTDRKGKEPEKSG